MIEATRSSSWLFVNGGESIHVVRVQGPALVVHGPGPARQRHDFAGEDGLQGYQMSLAEQLAERGWILYGVDRDRRVGERRANQRGTPDRRSQTAGRA